MLVLVVATVALIASVAAVPWLSGLGRTAVVTPAGVTGPGWMGAGQLGPGMMGGGVTAGGGMMAGAGSGMMTGRVWLAGDGTPVTSIAAARARAAQAAGPAGLHPGEVIWFSNGFYVELKDTAGNPSTEVIVDPATSAVTTEPGPAMMWTTSSRTASLSPEQAGTIAARWLDANRPGEAVGSVDTYPGYYSIDTTVGGKGAGMLSVNAASGAVWYHTWHGTFIAKEDS
jgi:hypothetical protein